jgi:uncharacterized DUF497 family protein
MWRGKKGITPRGAVVKRSYKKGFPFVFCVATIIYMEITCDSAKRAKNLEERGLDFLSAAEVFKGRHLTFTDDRLDYGEVRQITIGYLDGRMVMIGWTQRGVDRHVFTMRKTNEREIKKYGKRLEQI